MTEVIWKRTITLTGEEKWAKHSLRSIYNLLLYHNSQGEGRIRVESVFTGKESGKEVNLDAGDSKVKG